MSKNYLKIDEAFNKMFLTPIGQIVERAVLTIGDGKIYSQCISRDIGVGVYIERDIETDLEVGYNINLGDVLKLRNHIQNATDLEDSADLIINKNTIKYKSTKWRFTIHLFDDGIITKNKSDVNKILQYPYTTKFNLSYQAIREILKLKAANKEAEKVYFSYTEDGVYADVTDYTQANMDKSGMLICDEFEGDENIIGCPLTFEVIALLSKNVGADYVVKHTGNQTGGNPAQEGVFMLQTVVDGCSINYVASEIKN